MDFFVPLRTFFCCLFVIWKEEFMFQTNFLFLDYIENTCNIHTNRLTHGEFQAVKQQKRTFPSHLIVYFTFFLYAARVYLMLVMLSAIKHEIVLPPKYETTNSIQENEIVFFLSVLV